jgi:hypothetical protein
VGKKTHTHYKKMGKVIQHQAQNVYAEDDLFSCLPGKVARRLI